MVRWACYILQPVHQLKPAFTARQIYIPVPVVRFVSVIKLTEEKGLQNQSLPLISTWFWPPPPSPPSLLTQPPPKPEIAVEYFYGTTRPSWLMNNSKESADLRARILHRYNKEKRMEEEALTQFVHVLLRFFSVAVA